MADFATSQATLTGARRARGRARTRAQAAQPQQARCRRAPAARAAARPERSGRGCRARRAGGSSAGRPTPRRGRGRRRAAAAAGRGRRADGVRQLHRPAAERRPALATARRSPCSRCAWRPGSSPMARRRRRAAHRHQLWVRIYPDDCSIDTFEPTLSATELANAKRYWQGIWRAGGIEGDERAAWRGLVAAHGSGARATSSTTTSRSTSPTRPSRRSRRDEILVIATQTPLGAGRGGGRSAPTGRRSGSPAATRAAQQAARAALDAAVGAARADALISRLRAVQPRPTPRRRPRPSTTSRRPTAFVVFPPDPPTSRRPGHRRRSVTSSPSASSCSATTAARRRSRRSAAPVTTAAVRRPRPVGRPGTDPIGIHPEGDDLFVPDQLRVDGRLRRAPSRRDGHRDRPRPPSRRAAGFDRLLVFGVQLERERRRRQAALEELLQHHHVGRSGLALVAAGHADAQHHRHRAPATRGSTTPTRASTTARRAAVHARRPTRSASATGSGWPRRSASTPRSSHGVHGARRRGPDARPRDAARAVAGDARLLDGQDADAGVRRRTVAATRWFFTNYVSGRGPVPAIRIGGQPYGILPTTAFSRIAWLRASRPRRAAPALDAGAQPFLARLLAAAARDRRRLDDDEPQAPPTSASAGDAHQTLLDIVGPAPGLGRVLLALRREPQPSCYNMVNLWGLGPEFWQALTALALQAAGEELLARLGYSGRACRTSSSTSS